MRRACAFVLVLASVVFSSWAWAPRASADPAISQARSYFNVGAKHYRAGDYEAAIVAFQTGYRIKPLPLFLFNIALSAQKAGKPELALQSYRQFLAAEDENSTPNANLIVEAQVQIGLLERAQPEAQEPGDRLRELAEAEAQLDLIRREGEAQPGEAQPGKAQPGKAQPDAVAPKAAVLVAQPEPPAGRARWKRGWVWGVAGGSVAVGLGIALGVGLGVGLGVHHPPSTTLPPITFPN